MLNRNNQLASVNANEANEVAAEFDRIMKRFNHVRQSLDLSTCSDEFISAYSGLCEQLFDLANQVSVSGQWARTGQIKKLVVLGDKMRLIKEHIQCFYRQIEKTGTSPVFNYRRAA